jgi:predicted MFS family arabinose efflux permease
VRLGLRANLAQFSLLVAVNALVGGTLGQERTVVPLLAARTFHLTDFTAALTFILAFGTVKAITNFFAGTLSDRFGRKPVLVAGWLAALPIPPLLIWAPDWGWVVAANVLLGVNQPDLVHHRDHEDRPGNPARRDLAMGLNEAAVRRGRDHRPDHRAPGRRLRCVARSRWAPLVALGLGLSAAFAGRPAPRPPRGCRS